MGLLQPVYGTEATLVFHGETLHLIEVFDFRYPGMLPLFCILKDREATNLSFRACLLRLGDTYMLPVREMTLSFPTLFLCTTLLSPVTLQQLLP